MMLKILSMQFLFGGLLSLLTIINPLSKIPLFISLTRDMEPLARQQQARRACVYAGVIMLVSLLAGNAIMAAFGISYGALRIAGGFVLAVLGYRMLFLSQDPGNVPKPKDKERKEGEDYAFFPLAMPSISGPGTMAVVVGISTEIAELKTWQQMSIAFAMTFVAIALSCVAMWLVLRSSPYIASKLGRNGREVMTRLMGFLLICIAVQFVGSGIRTFMAGF